MKHQVHPYGEDGLSLDNPAEMSMVDGLMVDPVQITVDQVVIEHIALGLSNICRFGGQVRPSYSVAEHSINVAEIVARVLGREQVDFVHQALLHDAAETFLGDLIRPMKRRPEMAFYRTTDDAVTAVIMQAFRLPPKLHQVVKDADQEQLHIELGRRHQGVPVGILTSEEAEQAFLVFHKGLMRARGLD